MNTALIAAGAVSGLAFLIVFWKIDIVRVCGYDVYVDVGATVMLMWLYAGTFSGMLAALIGGLVVSIGLLIAKRVCGFERFESIPGSKQRKWVFHAELS